MRLTVSRAATATAAASLAMLTGCTTVYTGVGVRDPHADPNMVNTSLLDTGDFPTKPSDPLGTAKTREAGAMVEARRMAEVVLLPFEVDPRLTGSGKDAKPFNSSDRLTSTLYDNPAIGAAAGRHNLVAGFMTGASATESVWLQLTHIVMRFATAQDATAAAADMAEHSSQAPGGSSYKRSAHPIPDRPDTLAFTDEKDDGTFRKLTTYTAHGPYVIAEMIADETLDDAIRVALAAVDKQGPALDGFQATPVDQLADLPLDPSGLQARTLPIPKNASNDASGVYGPHGALHFMMNPLRDQKLFNDAGVTDMSIAFTTVYQTRDATTAGQVAADFVTQIGEMKYPTYSPDEPVSGMPAAHCMKPGGEAFRPMYRCVAPADRFVIEAAGPNTLEARRALAAQYVMLTAK